MTRLTFIVPVYEPRLDILAKCVRSLCDQSLKEWSAVFVLDGPNKGAADVIRAEIKKKPNAYKIVEQEHAGAQRARNHGAEYANSDFIVWWDSDCIIEPDTAKTWVDQLDKHQDIAFIYSDYKFLGEKGAIQSEPFDPWTLRVRNYISTCFPVRRQYAAKWNETLKSLHDWDFWLSVVENGGKGKYIPGYAFSTLYPEAKSISGEGCSDANWLSRVDAVKKLHNLPERDVCVSALGKKSEGIWLAKLIDADYQDYPNFKPHRYKTIIQLGFSFLPHAVEAHCGIFNEPDVKKVIFWTCDDITQVWSRLNYTAIKKYRTLLNSMKNLRQYVEDKSAADMMKELGFNVEVRPAPMVVGEAPPLPEKPKFLVDINPNYGPVMNVLDISLPDVELVNINGVADISGYTGLVHFHPDRTISAGMKRALLAGRSIVSNVQAPFAGYVDDTKALYDFIPDAVEKIRAAAKQNLRLDARDYYSKLVDAKEFVNAL